MVYDMCSGWGGRLLKWSSKLKIHYVGTDVNSNNKGCYEFRKLIMIIVMEQIL